MALSHCKNGMQYGVFTEWEPSCRLEESIRQTYNVPSDPSHTRLFLQRHAVEIMKDGMRRAEFLAMSPWCEPTVPVTKELWEYNQH